MDATDSKMSEHVMSLSLTDSGGSVQFGSTINADGTYTGGINIAQADTSEADTPDSERYWMIDNLGFAFGDESVTASVNFGMPILH